MDLIIDFNTPLSVIDIQTEKKKKKFNKNEEYLNSNRSYLDSINIYVTLHLTTLNTVC